MRMKAEIKRIHIDDDIDSLVLVYKGLSIIESVIAGLLLLAMFLTACIVWFSGDYTLVNLYFVLLPIGLFYAWRSIANRITLATILLSKAYGIGTEAVLKSILLPETIKGEKNSSTDEKNSEGYA